MPRAVRNLWIRTGVPLGVVALVCAFAWAGPVAAAPPAQAATGTITGQVLSLDGVPLANVLLSAYNQSPETPNRTPVGQYRSDAQGRYTAQVPTGTIWMQFETQDILGQSFWGYSNKPVNVAAGQTVTGEDFQVAIRALAATAVPATEATPTPVPAPPVLPVTSSTSPGMPATGAGPSLLLPLAAGTGLLLLLFGVALRLRALRG